jgi:uncharacterized protein (DUF934 family)
MALIRDDELVDDDARLLADDEALPATGRIVVSLARWQRDREILLARQAPIGVRLKSDESPEAIADDLGRLALVELEFPKFRDGRAYSNARILRERYGFRGELRAVGDVLMEQLHFMLRTGFNAFESAGADPLAQYRTAKAEFSVWYQPTGDGRATAINLRHRGTAGRSGR